THRHISRISTHPPSPRCSLSLSTHTHTHDTRHIPIISALRIQRQENCEFEASLYYIDSVLKIKG
ncbi:hypothetical protein LEMLEM_LOCUS18652, partial [Lemmus lemmus]